MTPTDDKLTDKQYEAMVNIVRHGYPRCGQRVFGPLERRGLVEHNLLHGTFRVTEAGLHLMMKRDGRLDPQDEEARHGE